MHIPVKVNERVERTKEYGGKKETALCKTIKILIPAIIIKQQNLKL